MILVTGGTGLVGSHLLLELTRENARIRAIYRPASDTGRVLKTFSYYLEDPEKQFAKIEWVQGDITDIEELLETMNGIDFVYHAAAEVSFRSGSRRAVLNNNINGTANVVNACLEKKIKKLCYVSSTAALGTSLPGKEVTEDLQWSYDRSRSTYSISKFKSEMEVWRGMAEGLNAVIVNPSIIVGPGEWDRSSSYLFSAVWKGINFYANGVTGYVDVRDVSRTMIDIMNSEVSGERYTLTSENLSFRQVLEMIAHALGKKPPRIHAGPFLLSITWRLDWFLCKLTGKRRSITRDAAVSSHRKSFFSNDKIRKATGIDFLPVEQSIKDTALIFLKQHSD